MLVATIVGTESILNALSRIRRPVPGFRSSCLHCGTLRDELRNP